MGGQLPKEPDIVRELWRLQIGLVEILVMGITIINTCYMVLPHKWKKWKLPPIAYSDNSDARSDDGDEDADDKKSESDFD